MIINDHSICILHMSTLVTSILLSFIIINVMLRAHELYIHGTPAIPAIPSSSSGTRWPGFGAFGAGPGK